MSNPHKAQIERVDMDYGRLPVLRDVSLALGHGEFISIVGPSGCGKSTLLKLISGLERPAKGRIILDGEEVRGTPPKVGFMFQRDTLLPWATVAQNIAVGLELGGIAQERHAERTAELIGFLGLGGSSRTIRRRCQAACASVCPSAGCLLMNPTCT